MVIEHITQLGMPLERWTHKSCTAEFGVGDDWATLYFIQSTEPGRGHATTLLVSARMYYKNRGKRFSGTVPLNSRMADIYKRLEIQVSL
jgi:hypothetical protein